ncbi:hypothetical protein DBR17_17780 [Sphingomonas sp. HMWF008]|nr:hypothetical protein DBR17_17780 [Sphingomonas sp. HMWF008]
MYATADDMRARYGEQAIVQLTDTDSWGAATIAAVNVKLASATARADGYVARYYQQSLGVAVPPLLVEIVCEIAYADLHKAPTEEADKRRKLAIADLVNISKGLVKLDQGAAEIPSREGQVIVPDRVRTFSRDSLGGF